MQARVRVLVVEDNDGDARLIAEALRDARAPAVDLDRRTSLAACTDYLQSFAPDAILLDLHLPDGDGLPLLCAVNRLAPHTPVLILTGQVDDGATASLALREGAQDFLLKDEFDTPILMRAIRYAMERKENESRLRDVQEQLLQAQRMEAIGRLAGGIAHDFNNLLTIVQGYARLMQETTPADHPHTQDLNAIIAAADRATTLTKQLLAYSRKQVMQMRVVDLATIVQSMEDLLRRTLGEDVTLLFRRDETPGLVEIDPRQFEQVILNLAVNSRDAMPRGGQLRLECRAVTLAEPDVRQHPEVRPGDYIRLEVADTGTGMEESVLNHIFDPFFTTKPFGKGTGLGLSIVYGIVKQSRGHVWAESKPDHGTSIFILLPRVDRITVSPSIPNNSPVTGGHESILLVEDEQEILDLLRTSLERLGYHIRVARSGREAMRLMNAATDSPDLAIMDIVLPDLSGPELFEGLRAVKPDLLALFMSAYQGDTITARGILPPDSLFISKPFTPDDLARRIRDALDHQAAPNKRSPRNSLHDDLRR